jgi:hypothetical protein
MADDKDRKKLSDEEMEDVAGGFTVPARPSGKGKKKGKLDDDCPSEITIELIPD